MACQLTKGYLITKDQGIAFIVRQCLHCCLLRHFWHTVRSIFPTDEGLTATTIPDQNRLWGNGNE